MHDLWGRRRKAAAGIMSDDTKIDIDVASAMDLQVIACLAFVSNQS
jgi:hypothetical protein